MTLEASDQCSLHGVNEKIAELVHRINELVDEEFSIQETQYTLDFLLKVNVKYSNQIRSYQEMLTGVRQAIVALTVKHHGNRKKADEMARKLYSKLYKANRKKTTRGELPEPVESWSIPIPFDIPKPTEPKLPPARSAMAIGFARMMFGTKNHYRPRSHLSLGRAQKHFKQLQAVHEQELAKHIEREKTLRLLESNINSASTRLVELKYQLFNPPNHIWQDVYMAYVNFVRPLLIHIDQQRTSSSNSTSAATYTKALDTQLPLLSTFPPVSSIRRMSGPDINKMPSMLALTEPAKKPPSHLESQQPAGINLDALFMSPLNLDMSPVSSVTKSASALATGPGLSTLKPKSAPLNVGNAKRVRNSRSESDMITGLRISAPRNPATEHFQEDAHDLLNLQQSTLSPLVFSQLYDTGCESVGSVYDDDDDNDVCAHGCFDSNEQVKFDCASAQATPDTPIDDTDYPLKPVSGLNTTDSVRPLRINSSRKLSSLDHRMSVNHAMAIGF